MKGFTTRNLLVIILMLVIVWAGNIVPSQAKPSAAGGIVIGLHGEPNTLDYTGNPGTIGDYICPNIYENLVDLSPEGNVVPGLALSWKVSDDGKEMDFTLRKKVIFHSGDKFTAQDVIFSYQRMLEKNPYAKRLLRSIEKIDIIDDYHIRIHFKQPDALFLPMRARIRIGSKAYHDRVGEEKYDQRPVGTGPYQLVVWKLGEYIDLERNDKYWGRLPEVKKARFKIVKEDTTRVAMLLAGEADIVMETPFAKVAEVQKAGFKIVKAPAHPSCSLQFHTENPNVPWHDQRVRLAMAMAIDSKAIVADLFNGIPGHYARLAPWELGYDPELKPYPYNVEKARQLLAEAGYAKGFEMPLYYITGRAAGQRETAEVVSVFLKAINIECKVEGIETIKIMRRVMKEWAHNPDGVFVGISTHPMAHQPDPTNSLDMVFWSTSRASMTHVPGLDAIHEKLRATLDDDRRGALIRQAMKLVHEYVPSILIWANNSVFSMKQDIDYAPTLRFGSAVMYLKNVRIT